MNRPVIYQVLLAARARTRTTVISQTRSYSSHPGTLNSIASTRSKITTLTLHQLYRDNVPITALTAHDFPSGLVADNAGVEIVLVGDSLAMVALGYENTNMLTLDEMLHHCRAVARGSKTAFLVGDLPFGSYEQSQEIAVQSAIKMVQQGHVEAVKLEGGHEVAKAISAITRFGIPVMGHIGLTPQRSAALGGFKVQANTIQSARDLLDTARALQHAGCFAIVLEAVPSEVARIVTESIDIPTIGIGAGSACSGQVLVQLDMVGGFQKFTPKFVKKFDNIYDRQIDAISQYVDQVKARQFPGPEHCYGMKTKEDAQRLIEWEQEKKSKI
ncbi:ketopantoate hydroxymethyltransferase [Lipomyces japonicus]|uniref:ketopantoate hydroxymethyltransferase n=1 Tax=Lipomyces japonicus TaxID=56871 RepID=UPI0034CF59C8